MPEDVFATPAEIRLIRWLMYRAIRADRNAREKEEKRLAMCQGKHSFHTFEEAQAVVRHKDVTPFHCDLCTKWHLGGADVARLKRLKKNFMRERKYTPIERG